MEPVDETTLEDPTVESDVHLVPGGNDLVVASGVASDRGVLRPAVLGVVVGLLTSVAIIWFFLADSDSDQIAGTESTIPETVDIGVEPEDTGDNTGTVPDTTTTSTTAVQAPATTAGIDSTPDNGAVGDDGGATRCPESAGIDRRSSPVDSALIEEWASGDIVVMLCSSGDGSVTYFGSSDQGTIYLDTEQTPDGYVAQNGDTSYLVTEGLLRISYPSETLTFELTRTR